MAFCINDQDSHVIYLMVTLRVMKELWPFLPRNKHMLKHEVEWSHGMECFWSRVWCCFIEWKFGVNLIDSIRFVLSARLSKNEGDSESDEDSESSIVSGLLAVGR